MPDARAKPSARPSGERRPAATSSKFEVRSSKSAKQSGEINPSNFSLRTSNSSSTPLTPADAGSVRPARSIRSIYEPNNRRFNVIILAAGFGSRVRPHTGDLPKALIELDGSRAIDLLIRKYRFITERLILSTGYHAELLEYYVKGKYPELETVFSRERVEELAGPGRSFLRALDRASSFLPTLACFCDILIGDEFDVSSDAVLLCNPAFVSSGSVVDRYRNVAQVEEGVVTDLVPCAEAPGNRNGFTGTAVFQNTMLLKKICYEAALQGRDEYTLDFVRGYARQARVSASYTSEIFEFGTMESLTEMVAGSEDRERVDALTRSRVNAEGRGHVDASTRARVRAGGKG